MKKFSLILSMVAIGAIGSWTFVACGDDDGGSNTTQEICNDSIDNDGDGATDCFDSDCSADPACQAPTTETSCTDGVDNDKDGKTDCMDADCVSDPACASSNNTNNGGNNGTNNGNNGTNNGGGNNGSGSCDTDHIFFDSTPSPADVCPDGQVCYITDQNLNVGCVNEAVNNGGTYYGACGPNGECPVGSACFGTGDGTATECMPFCNAQTHPTCPQDGLCIYGTSNQSINLCAQPDNCDVVDYSAVCDEGEGCYFASKDGDTICTPAGTKGAGESCQYVNECQPGYLCAGQPATCMQVCHTSNSNECPSGTSCQSIGIGDYGVCAAAQGGN